MSRSYRKPFTYVTGLPKATSHEEKKLASRRRRSVQNLWLRRLTDFDAALVPHRWGCPSNDVWGWSRDGIATPHLPSPRNGRFIPGYREDWLKCHRK
jgi:hypothetical protein